MTRLSALAALLLVLTACGSEDPEAEPSAPENSASTPSESSDSESPATDSDAQQDLQAKIITNAPPKNLTWIAPKTPTSWRQLKGQSGIAQWKVGQEPCTVVLNQPAGVGSGTVPSSEQVLKREISQLADSVKAAGMPRITREPVMVANKVVGLDGSSLTKFAHARITFDNDVVGDVRAYRSGDFALIAWAVCGKNRFDSVFTQEIEPFLDKLMAKTTY